MRRLVLVFLVAFAGAAFGLEPWQQLVDVARFQRIAEKVAPQVDIFDEVWRKDPKARFYGGSSRDYLWFIRKKLAECRDEACIQRVETELSNRLIDAKEFVVGESDIDVVADAQEISVDFDKAHFQRIETIRPRWLHEGSDEYQQEVQQGGLPVEKILLGKNGFENHPVPEYCSGIREIWAGKPTLHYDARITQTKMYGEGGNHPLLLALRYLRQVAVAYYQRYGSGPVNEAWIETVLDSASVAAIEAVFADARRAPGALDRFFANPDFKKRLNRQLRRIFRAYTNPNASKALFQRFQVDPTLELFEGKGIEPYHTVVYSKIWDKKRVARARAAKPALAARLCTVREWAARNGLSIESTDDGDVLYLYHGTRSLLAYRSIVFQGILPSPAGSAGEGPYAVDRRSLEFAENWSRGSPDATMIGSPLVVKLRVRADAMMLDLSDGSQSDATALAEELGADVVRYQYGAIHAYVVKNGAAIARAEGHSVQIMPLPVARAFFDAHQNEPEVLRRQIAVDPWLAKKLSYLLPTWAPDELFDQFGEYMGDPIELAKEAIRRITQGEVAAERVERVLDRFLWRPLRAGTLGRSSSYFYSDVMSLLPSTDPILGTQVFRRMQAAGVLAPGATYIVLGGAFGLALAHASFPPGWAARYAARLQADPEAYRAEVEALGKSPNPLLALAFQGMAWDEAVRNQRPLPPFVPVDVAAEHWADLAILGNTVNSLIQPAALAVAAYGEQAPNWVAAIGEGAAKLRPSEKRHTFDCDVASVFSRRYFRPWSRSVWNLFLHVGPWLHHSLETWIVTRYPDPIEIPEVPPGTEVEVETFFRELAPRFAPFREWEQDQIVYAMVDAWLPPEKREAFREALRTGDCPQALATAH